MKKILVLLVVLAISMFAVSAFAYDVKVDDDTYAKVGAKVQIKITDTDTTTDNETHLTIPNARIYFAGQVTNMVKFGLNYDFATDGDGDSAGGRATDAQITLDFSKELKVMTGIYRVAFSRLALQDSYQYILITAPAVANAVAPVSTGAAAGPLATYRNAGITVWGDLMDGKLRYNVATWDDDYNPVGASATDDHRLMSGRVVFNFLDPEKGYTCAGCYLGKANIANVGFGYLTQDYGNNLTYTAMTIDGFYESNGLTLEAAYFKSDDDTGVAGAKPTGWYVEGAFMLDKLQPAVRYESYDDDGIAGGDYTRTVAGINYLFDGQNAKVGLEYLKHDPDGAASSTDYYSVQLQVQF